MAAPWGGGVGSQRPFPPIPGIFFIPRYHLRKTRCEPGGEESFSILFFAAADRSPPLPAFVSLSRIPIPIVKQMWQTIELFPPPFSLAKS